MVPNSENLLLDFVLHILNEIGRRRVVTTRKKKVLPDEDSFSAAHLVEGIILDNTSSPNT